MPAATREDHGGERNGGELFGLADVDKSRTCNKCATGRPEANRLARAAMSDRKYPRRTMRHARDPKRNHERKSALAWAVAAAAVPLLAMASPASAQYPSQNNGRARDANNRV